MSDKHPLSPFGMVTPDAIASFWKSFGTMAGGAEPMLRNAARINLEVAGFAANRARAYADIPAVLARCRAPHDLFAAQMQFWQTANQEYMATARRIGEAWQGALTAGQAASNGADAAMRDFITFPEPKAETQAQTPATPSRRPSDRRAAA